MAFARVGFETVWVRGWPDLEPSARILFRDELVVILKGASLPQDHPIVTNHPEFFDEGGSGG